MKRNDPVSAHLKWCAVILLLLIFGSLKAQIIEVVSDPAENPVSESAIVGDKLYVFNPGNSFLLEYNGTGAIRYHFPMYEGSPLSLTSMKVYESSLYVRLYSSSGAAFLYRFDGSRFIPITLSGRPVSHLVVYQDKLFFVEENGSNIRLMEYNGVSARGVTALVPTLNYRLHVTDQHLFIHGGGPYVSDPDYIIRYDGASFRTLPAFENNYLTIQKIISVPGTQEAYIQFIQRMVYYDGTAVSTVYDAPGSITSDMKLWRGAVYVQVGLGSDGISLYRIVNGLPTALTMPAGNLVLDSDIEVYNDRLWIPFITSDDRHVMLRYDGSVFGEILTFSSDLLSAQLYVDNSRLIIVPRVANDRLAFAYDGSSISVIEAPEGKYIYRYLGSTSCFYAWDLLQNPIPPIGDYEWYLGIDDKDAACSTSYTVIPDRLRDYYQYVEMIPWARERDWCWTDIVIDWDINPACPFPPFCPDPPAQVSLSDAAGKVVYSKTIMKPSQLDFPVNDIPYTLSFALTSDGKSFDDVLVFDQALVGDGIEKMYISAKPGNDYFRLMAETVKEEKVPLLLTLLNKKGTTIWQKEFIAPMDVIIKDRVAEPGAKLVFSSGSGDGLKGCGIEKVSYFPNPTDGPLTLDIGTYKGKKVPVSITLADFSGNVIANEKLIAPLKEQFSLKRFNPGTYVLTVACAGGKESFMILKQ